jgi:hypothetical protein
MCSRSYFHSLLMDAIENLSSIYTIIIIKGYRIPSDRIFGENGFAFIEYVEKVDYL